MKFRDFLLKGLLADTDYLVGYDADGRYIRISRSDLAASVASSVVAPTLTVQYSVNGDSWHDSYAAGDCYIRIKAGSGAWSGAIRISVSAYDIWLAQGNSGSEADFLASLKGEDGDGSDLSGLTLQDINGYSAFLELVNTTIQNARDAIVESATAAAVENTLEHFVGLRLEDITEVRSLSDDDFLTVVTSDGLRKIKIGSLSDNVAVRTVSADSLARSVDSQLAVIGLEGAQDGENVVFRASSAFIAGTTHLFLNGQRLVAGTDYSESGRSITMLEYAPEDTDSLVLIAVKK